MNNQARAPPRTSARVLAWVRASTPVRTSIPVRTPTPARASSTPARTPHPAQIPTSVRTLNPVLIPTSSRAPTSVQTPAPARTPNPVQMTSPAQTPTPMPTLARTPTPVQTSTSARIPNPVQTPTPAGGPTPIPTLARTLTPVQTPASAWTPNPVQMLTPPPAPVPVPTQPRTPTPIQTYARTPTPVQTPNPIQMPTPPRTPTPGPTLARPPAPLPTSARTPTPVPTLARPPAPLPTSARTPTPVQTPNHIQMPTPPRTPTPGPTLARPLAPLPTSARTPTPVPTLARPPAPLPTSARTPTPVPTLARPPAPLPTSARTPTPVPTLARPPAPLPTSARTPTPVQTPTPLAIRTAVRTPTRIRTPTPLQMPTQVRAPIPARTPTQIWTPTPARTPTPISSPGEVEAAAAAPASESFGSSALPLEPPPEPASEPTTASPHQDLSPTPSVKPLPSVTNGFGSTQEPLPDLTPPATDFPGPTLGSTSRADSSVTKLTDSTSEAVRVPIPGTDPFAATALATSTNTFAPVGESCSVDKIAVRVIYCGLWSYGLRYILLKKSLEQQFPNCLLFEEERAAQATGEFEVFVDGKLVHSKKKGDGFVDEARLQKIMNVIKEEVRKRSLSGMPRRAEMLPSVWPSPAPGLPASPAAWTGWWWRGAGAAVKRSLALLLPRFAPCHLASTPRALRRKKVEQGSPPPRPQSSAVMPGRCPAPCPSAPPQPHLPGLPSRLPAPAPSANLLIDNAHNFLQPGLIPQAITFLGTEGKEHGHVCLPPTAPIPAPPTLHVRSPSSNTSNSPDAWAGWNRICPSTVAAVAVAGGRSDTPPARTSTVKLCTSPESGLCSRQQLAGHGQTGKP